jgi:membrane associated rhomboid family serine protease
MADPTHLLRNAAGVALVGGVLEPHVRRGVVIGTILVGACLTVAVMYAIGTTIYAGVSGGVWAGVGVAAVVHSRRVADRVGPVARLFSHSVAVMAAVAITSEVWTGDPVHLVGVGLGGSVAAVSYTAIDALAVNRPTFSYELRQ